MTTTVTKAESLAARLWLEKPSARFLRAALLALIGATILTVSAKVKVPFYPVPMTLQTLAVLALGVAYGWRLALASVALYLAEGLVGLPVFANTPPLVAGPAYLVGPTGGFLAGFFAATAIGGLAAERGLDRSALRLIPLLALADAALLACGFLWLAYGAGLGLDRAWTVGIAPFLLGEALKVALAATLVQGTWRLVERRA